MSDPGSIYALMKEAHQSGAHTDNKMYGVEVALVTSNKDEQKLGRVKVCFPRLPGKPESDWIRVAQPAAGPDRGFYWIPEVNDEVLVAFERGETNRPYVIGALWNGKDKPMKDAPREDNSLRLLKTKSGHTVALDDKKGEEKIVIADQSGKRKMTFDVKEKKLVLQGDVGDIEIHAPKGKVKIACKEFELKTEKAVKIEAGGELEATAKDKATYKAGPQLNIQANRVNIN